MPIDLGGTALPQPLTAGSVALIFLLIFLFLAAFSDWPHAG